MVTSTAAQSAAVANAGTERAEPVQGEQPPEPRAHQVVAEAMDMRTRGDAGPAGMGRLQRRGFNEREALTVFTAINSQLDYNRAVDRRVRTLLIASVVVQLLLALVMASLDLVAAPIPAIIAVAIVARLCRADAVTARQWSRQRHLFG